MALLQTRFSPGKSVIGANPMDTTETCGKLPRATRFCFLLCRTKGLELGVGKNPYSSQQMQQFTAAPETDSPESCTLTAAALHDRVLCLRK